MSKPHSYYDWEQSFKNSQKKSKNLIKNNEFPLGIPSYLYKSFLEEWKKKNL